MLSGNLFNLRVLLIDCQTTGSSPKKGHLLEVGWCWYRASDDELDPGRIESSLVELPSGSTLPPAITRLTGIGIEDLVEAPSAKEVWSSFSKAITVSGPPSIMPALAVAHFARFEEQFFRDLYQELEEEGLFPLRFLCTHEIARRLYPDLPRRGLRALAGFFGHPLPALKRA